MDLEANKLSLIQKILLLNDERMITLLNRILIDEKSVESEDFWNVMSDYDKTMIEKSLKDYEEGRVYAHDDVIKAFRKQYSK